MWKTFAIFILLAAGSMQAADFFPLTPGNTWTYRDTGTGSTFEVRVSTPIVVNQRMYHSVRGFGPSQLMLRFNDFGNLVMWDEELELEKIVTSFETGNIGQFEAYGRQCPETGRTQKDRVQHEGPAGRWSAVEIQYQPYGCADAGELSEQYVENVGMVRRVANTFAGPRIFDLVHARIGNQTIAAGEVGRFTVSAVPGRDGASWDATLRVDPYTTLGVKVRFPSSQEYDLRLRADDGTVLWTWSADKLFLQAEHTVANIGGWTASVNVPHPPAIPEGNKTYLLEAWLTTAEGEPKFAAATRLVLGYLGRAEDTRAARRR